MCPYRVPLKTFEKIYHTTSTIVFPLPEITGLNLPAIFSLLPILNINLPKEVILSQKGGKIIYPSWWNIEGEILSMKYENETRGIVRSSCGSFPTAISIDIGTSVRPISVFFSQTIKITGPPTFDIAEEALNSIINRIILLQKWLTLIKKNSDIFNDIAKKFLLSYGDKSIRSDITKTVEYITYIDLVSLDNKINKDKNLIECFEDILYTLTQGLSKERAEHFINNLLIPFDGILYTGKLDYSTYQSEMINIPFDLGFTINQNNLAKIMNKFPFNCCYNNARTSSTLLINYFYNKKDRKGLIVTSKHTFKVNKSGYVMYSGPNLRDMEILYYAFLKRILLNIDFIKSTEQYVRKVKISNPIQYSLAEWIHYLKSEQDLRDDIINNRVKYVYLDHYTNNPSLLPELIDPENNNTISSTKPLQNITRVTISSTPDDTLSITPN